MSRIAVVSALSSWLSYGGRLRQTMIYINNIIYTYSNIRITLYIFAYDGTTIRKRFGMWKTHLRVSTYIILLYYNYLFEIVFNVAYYIAGTGI